MRVVWLALTCYLFTVLIVLSGAWLGYALIQAPSKAKEPGDLIKKLAYWDGRFYERIVTDGYSYSPELPSDVAFFPLFPLLAQLLVEVGDLRPDLALLIVAHLGLIGAFIVLALYVKHRLHDGAEGLRAYVLLAFGLWPTTFFFRMAYTESLFFLLAALALYGMQRGWSLLVIAGLIGLATGTRATGLALLVPMAIYLWRWSRGWRERLCALAIFLPLSCWGLFGFMLFQLAGWDDPLAFAKAQANWGFRPEVSLSEKLLSLVTLEPLWSVFVESSPCWWRGFDPALPPFFSLAFGNSFWWVGSVALVVIGWRKGWLDSLEWSLALALLLIPYLAKSHETCMAGMGRFAAVVLPIYLVLGHLLAALPASLAALLLSLSAFFIGTYAALFVAGYPLV
jgi:hypothetical protein